MSGQELGGEAPLLPQQEDGTPGAAGGAAGGLHPLPGGEEGGGGGLQLPAQHLPVCRQDPRGPG